jgi:O-antigen biosynthesis protein
MKNLPEYALQVKSNKHRPRLYKILIITKDFLSRNRIIAFLLPKDSKRREFVKTALYGIVIILKNQPFYVKKSFLCSTLIRKRFSRQKRKSFESFLNSKELLKIPKKKPLVSIMLVFYNHAELSYSCIKSIINFVDADIPYEVIIVDNNSTDRTGLLLERISGAKIIRNKENRHFIVGCNQALEQVEGEYILFLNNDAELLKHSLSSALTTIKTIPDCGAVGGKVILPGGILQEAGSIIWSDGSCMEYGRGQSPTSPEFNFYRIVDYCTGAFLLTKTSLFKAHGGFDELFSPAYYEETDYCLWLQTQKLKVIYNPNAVVRHFNFGSSNFNSAIQIQKKNKEIFSAKHKDTLKKHYEPDSSNILKARFSASHNNKKILYIDDCVPHVDSGAGYPRANSILRCIRELGYDVTIYPNTFPDAEDWDEVYRDIDPFTEIASGYGFKRLSEFISKRRNYYDIVWISRLHNMELTIKSLRKYKGELKIVYDSEAIVAEREYTKSLLTRGKTSDFNKMLQEELALCRCADTVVSVSMSDAEKFESHGFKNVYVLGSTYEKRETPFTFKEREGLLFVGNLDYDDSPNVDSILYFVNEVLPLVREKITDIELHIVGTCKSRHIRELNRNRVYIHGRIPDLFEFYNRCRVFIAPTRYASGIPCKIQEAASFGLPVVATDILVKQVGWKNRKHLIASRPEKNDFFEKVVELYQNEKLWMDIRENAYSVIESEFTYSDYKDTVSRILNSVWHP